MTKLAFFDAKEYDKNSFDIYAQCQQEFPELLMQWMNSEQGKSILTHILSGGNIIEFVFVTLFIVGTGIVCPILLYKWVWIKNKFTSRIFK